MTQIKVVASLAGLLATLGLLVGCSSSPDPLSAKMQRNSVCTPARGRVDASLSEIITNHLAHTLRITKVEALNPENVDLKFTRAGKPIAELPVVTGNADTKLFKGLTSGPITVPPSSAFQVLAYGQVEQPDKNAVVHGFRITYQYMGREYTAETPSTLTYSASECA